MQEMLHVMWANGMMNLNLPEFFPTSAARTRKLLKSVIFLDVSWPDLVDDLIRYLTDRRAELTEDSLRKLANAYADEATAVSESKEVFEREHNKLIRIREARDKTKTKAGKDFLKVEYQKQKDTVDRARLRYQRHCSTAADYKRRFLRQQRAMRLYDADLEVLKEVRK